MVIFTVNYTHLKSNLGPYTVVNVTSALKISAEWEILPDVDKSKLKDKFFVSFNLKLCFTYCYFVCKHYDQQPDLWPPYSQRDMQQHHIAIDFNSN